MDLSDYTNQVADKGVAFFSKYMMPVLKEYCKEPDKMDVRELLMGLLYTIIIVTQPKDKNDIEKLHKPAGVELLEMMESIRNRYGLKSYDMLNVIATTFQGFVVYHSAGQR